MHASPSVQRILQPVFLMRFTSAVLSITIIGFWIMGCAYYTSFGVDHDQLDGTMLRSSYYRVRWPGDGSLWIGGGSFSLLPTDHPVEPFDLGGLFFAPPRRPEPQSHWNERGFWWVQRVDTTSDVTEHWLGVPGWLPILITSLPLLPWRTIRQRVTGTRPAW